MFEYSEIVFLTETMYRPNDDEVVKGDEPFLFLMHRPDRKTILLERLDRSVTQISDKLVMRKSPEETLVILNDKIKIWEEKIEKNMESIQHHEKALQKAHKKLKGINWCLPKQQENYEKFAVTVKLMGNMYYPNSISTTQGRQLKENYENAKKLYLGTKSAIEKYEYRINDVERFIGRCQYEIDSARKEIANLTRYKEKYEV